MTVIKCKMCGGDMELSTDKTFGSCEYCGSVMTLPKVDGEQTAAAFNRGNHFRRAGEFDKASWSRTTKMPRLTGAARFAGLESNTWRIRKAGNGSLPATG